MLVLVLGTATRGVSTNPFACVVGFNYFFLPPTRTFPGSERAKRWEDVTVIRDAGIDVLTSLNVQHLESLNDQVCHVTGIRVRETVPD